ncbi:TspO/MBR family protein [Salinirubrum litoreum]|uniref:TspO/MBR family protein n=1 Tax=Salinirubrum litoreum TaxID=1126234 RepID=A0ABD5RCH5_9EURY|nr:TspO/MBR family protein [Salinirubrum litoreum]
MTVSETQTRDAGGQSPGDQSAGGLDRRDLLTAGGFVLLVNAVGASGALLGGPGSPWFAALTKPWFYPPGWAFGVVWTALFSLMGVALWLVWRAGTDRREVRVAIGAFAGQMVLNLAWTPAFFSLQRPLVALGIILALWVAILGTMVAFRRVSRWAALLLGPYLLWVSFAAVLNFELWRLN